MIDIINVLRTNRRLLLSIIGVAFLFAYALTTFEQQRYKTVVPILQSNTSSQFSFLSWTYYLNLLGTITPGEIIDITEKRIQDFFYEQLEKSVFPFQYNKEKEQFFLISTTPDQDLDELLATFDKTKEKTNKLFKQELDVALSVIEKNIEIRHKKFEEKVKNISLNAETELEIIARVLDQQIKIAEELNQIGPSKQLPSLEVLKGESHYQTHFMFGTTVLKVQRDSIRDMLENHNPILSKEMLIETRKIQLAKKTEEFNLVFLRSEVEKAKAQLPNVLSSITIGPNVTVSKLPTNWLKILSTSLACSIILCVCIIFLKIGLPIQSLQHAKKLN